MWFLKLGYKNDTALTWLFPSSYSPWELGHHAVRKPRPRAEALSRCFSGWPQPRSSANTKPKTFEWTFRWFSSPPQSWNLPTEAPDSMEQRRTISAMPCPQSRSPEITRDFCWIRFILQGQPHDWHIMSAQLVFIEWMKTLVVTISVWPFNHHSCLFYMLFSEFHCFEGT